jgi:hypothetical protein
MHVGSAYRYRAKTHLTGNSKVSEAAARIRDRVAALKAGYALAA